MSLFSIIACLDYHFKTDSTVAVHSEINYRHRTEGPAIMKSDIDGKFLGSCNKSV